ncbi:MAG TPA: hypothetical protein VFI31_22615 [Pirellulales bacterium]|nr:hypothetical protein [Pirellulales bacterium]
MNHEPLQSDVISAIEACRPGQHDERLPEVAEALAAVPAARLAEVRRRVERLDRSLAAAVQQAPVPAGLADRILAQLAAADEQAAIEQREGDGRLAAAEHPDEDAASLDPEPLQEQRSGSIRRWLKTSAWAGLALAASLLIALAVWPRETLDVADVHARARELYQTDDHRLDLSAEAPPTPLGGVAPNSVAGWRPIEFLGRDGYAYELDNRRAKATLYVVPLQSWFGPRLGGLGTVPTPQSTSGATVAAWTAGAQVYVLVVNGGMGSFSSFLPRSMA